MNGPATGKLARHRADPGSTGSGSIRYESIAMSNSSLTRAVENAPQESAPAEVPASWSPGAGSVGRYLIRPRQVAAQSLALADRRFDRPSREKQIREVIEFRQTDPVSKELTNRLRLLRHANVLTPDETINPITGVRAVEMDADEAQRFAEQLPEVVVFKDEPIDLIKPARDENTRTNKLRKKDCWHLRSIGLDAARKKRFNGDGTGVVVAVLDSGVDGQHPEIKHAVRGGITFGDPDAPPQPQHPVTDTSGHGTHVAGLLCGKTVGVAPGARIDSVVMMPNGRGTLFDIVRALEWVAQRTSVHIVNISAGIPGFVDGMQLVMADVLAVSVLPVVAVGNEGVNLTRSPGNYPTVVSVGAVGREHGVWGGSSGSAIVFDHHQYVVPSLVAPGEGVYSSVPGGAYEAWTGTSLAAPIVSGVAALILQKKPRIHVIELKDLLLTTCQDLKLKPVRQGEGLVQITGALK